MDTYTKAASITEYSNTAGQREGSCYRKKPCKECRHCLTIKDILVGLVQNEHFIDMVYREVLNANPS